MTFEKYVWQQEFQNLSLAGQMIENLDYVLLFFWFLFLQVMNWEVLSCSLLPKGSDQVPLTKFNTYYFSKYEITHLQNGKYQWASSIYAGH